MIVYYMFLVLVLYAAFMWIQCSPSIIVRVFRSLVVCATLGLSLLKAREVCMAEFIVSDPEPSGVLQHGIWCCKLIAYRFLSRFSSFSVYPLVKICRRVYLVKYKGNVYLIAEVHSLTLSGLKEKSRRVREIIQRVLSGCRVVGVFVRSFSSRFSKVDFSSENLPSFLPDCVLIYDGRRTGLYHFGGKDVKKSMLWLKPYVELDEASLLELCERMFKGLYPSQRPTFGYVIGRRMVGDIVLNEPVLFDFNGHVLMVGKTGSGKTTLLANLIQGYAKQGFDVIVLDSFGELSVLGNEYVAGESFFLNPFDFLDPEEVLDLVEKVSVLFLEERGVFSPMVRQVLDEALTRLYSKGEEITFSKLIEVLKDLEKTAPQDIRTGCDAAIRRLKLFHHPVFEKTSFPEFKGVYVINLSSLSQSGRFFFSHILLEVLYRSWSPERPLVIAIDELMPIQRVVRNRVPASIIDELAKCSRKLNIRFILGNQEYGSLPDYITNMPSHLFVFKAISTNELRELSAFLARILERSEDSVYRELSMLRPGECFYISSNGVVKVKVKWIPLAPVRRKRMLTKSTVNYSRLKEISAEYKVKVDKLAEVVLRVSREDFLEALKKGDYEWLARFNLAHAPRRKLSKLGLALAAYYSIDVSQVG